MKDNAFARAYIAGPGTRLPANIGISFERYREAAIRPVSRVEEIHEWLRLCRYVTDRELFGREDVWIHPEDFEKTRSGDCEDHALWAWVQYARLGWNVRFTAGLHKGTGHAWLTLFRRGAVLVHETTAKSEDYELRDAQACPQYVPVWSVNGGLRFFWHGPGRA